MFSNNCEYQGSMHGALEVYSRRAVEVYAARSEAECCFDVGTGSYVHIPCGSPGGARPEQEDVFMRKCMIQLGVKPLNDFSVLAEDSCHWDWKTCLGNHVAFHPFKELWAWQNCLRNAEQRG